MRRLAQVQRNSYYVRILNKSRETGKRKLQGRYVGVNHFFEVRAQFGIYTRIVPGMS